jgi:hypothetical protein
VFRDVQAHRTLGLRNPRVSRYCCFYRPSANCSAQSKVTIGEYKALRWASVSFQQRSMLLVLVRRRDPKAEIRWANTKHRKSWPMSLLAWKENCTVQSVFPAVLLILSVPRAEWTHPDNLHRRSYSHPMTSQSFPRIPSARWGFCGVYVRRIWIVGRLQRRLC